MDKYVTFKAVGYVAIPDSICYTNSHDAIQDYFIEENKQENISFELIRYGSDGTFDLGDTCYRLMECFQNRTPEFIASTMVKNSDLETADLLSLAKRLIELLA